MTNYTSPMINDEGKIIQNGTPYVRVVDGPEPYLVRCEWTKSSYCRMNSEEGNFVAIEMYTPASRIARASINVIFVCPKCFEQNKEQLLSLSPLQKRLMPKTAHANCDHPKTKSARAKCRREKR